MKEASGEANMTVITIVLIGVIAAVAVPLVTNLMSGVQDKADCQAKGCIWKDNACKQPSGTGNC